MYQIVCPHCGVRLRVKDRSFAGRQVDCPDCRMPVAIQIAADGELTGIAARPDATGSIPGAPAADRPLSEAVRERRISPAWAAWCTALAGFVALLLYVFSSGRDPEVAGSPVAASSPAEKPAERPAAPSDETPEARLANIGREIAGYVDSRGVFPATPVQPGVPVDQRFSWIGTLIAAQTGDTPDLDHAWNDPVNDRFVRQRIPRFQNPNHQTLTGPAGHPVSHFAGVAGVGVDAPGLQATHARAGMFGTRRSTRVEDVKDGLASTMMVAGVQGQLDSWAANGHATVRPLTEEPYVEGPDGFGTGEQGGMTVLMADGSVRFLSGDTDPVLIRRMAAIADGLPLDMSVPGEPGEATVELPAVAVEPPPAIPPDEPGAAEPIEVPLAADEPLFDMDAALGQPVVEFNQSTPRPVGELLKLIAEMGGVAVDTGQLDESSTDRLDKLATFSVQNTTVRGVLDAAVHAAGLSYTLGDGVVVLSAAQVDSDESPSSSAD